jgi:hypothetical protein
MMHSESYLFLLGLCPLVALPLVIGVRTVAKPRPYIIAAPAKFTQSRRIL